MNIEDLSELIDFREDGYLTAKTNIGKMRIGQRVGCVKKDGYRYVGFGGKNIKEHRIIYTYYHGEIPDSMCIDHINGIKDDNRIENLRLVTKQENGFNTSAKGYSWDKRDKKWKAEIMVDGKSKFLGYFDNKEAAHQAYLKAKEIYHIIPDRTCL